MDAEAPYTDASRARLAFSLAAQELAEAARTWVRVYPGELRSTGGGGSNGTMVEDARRLCAQADAVLRQMVVYERLGGASWSDIGDAFGITKQAAHDRYAAAEREFREALREPEAVSDSGVPYVRLSPAAHEPEVWAMRLDEWTLRHREPGDWPDDEHPVSGQLARMDPLSELEALGGQRWALFKNHMVPPPENLLAIARRELTIWEGLCKEGSRRGRADAAKSAAETRERVKRLEAQVASAAVEASEGSQS